MLRADGESDPETLFVHFAAAASGATARREPGREALVEAAIQYAEDAAALLRAVQEEGERLWHAIPEWHWTGKTVDEIVPPSYPVRG